ncbi:probable ubiquitin-conjugating enzyme E2 23 [Lolium rigidum]|uniref:probable ubiquitin-conjugating enzyme E2 23 n=1 Tax=Lolium rigidum TaxID=89674 RepID=UPI001F5D4F12|nr:probable ubiquitin-conjugating enzyme E2 23 [Lolium rigidum]
MDVVAEDAVGPREINLLDLVRVESKGDGPGFHGCVVQVPGAARSSYPSLPIGTFRIMLVDGTLKTAEAGDITVVDRGYLCDGEFVVSAGRVGIVTGVNTSLDLVKLSDGEPAAVVMSGVSPDRLRRVIELSLGDFVVSVSGSWLGRALAPPAAYQHPNNLTFFCSAESDWGIGDRCFVRDKEACSSSSPSPSDVGNDHQKKLVFRIGERRTRREQRRRAAFEQPLSVANTSTTADVLWQDGTRQSGAPSTSLTHFYITSVHEFFPELYVVDKAVIDEAGGQTGRVGLIRSVNFEDQSVAVSWFKQASNPDEGREDCTASVYDLALRRDPLVFYGQVVVRVLPSAAGSPSQGRKMAATDLSWVGRVVDLRDGRVQVKWGDGGTSMVLPHEISVVNGKHYSVLHAEMGIDWEEEDGGFDGIQDEEGEDDSADEDDDDSVDEDGTDSADENDHLVDENGTDSPGIDLRDEDGAAVTRTSRLGAIVQYVLRLAGVVLAQAMRYRPTDRLSSSSSSSSTLAAATANVGAPALLTVGHDDTNNGDAIHATAAASATSDDDDDDSAAKGRSIADATGDEDQFRFPHFDVTQSPPDHHYIDNLDQGSNGGKKWVKAVHKEWKILENNLPDTIYIRAFEDRMDLVRAVMVGASGTPYQDGLFFFDMHLPPSYPAVPPLVYYHSFGLQLNPNLYGSGTVCLSLLNTFGGEGSEVWLPTTSTLLQVVVSIQGLILNDKPFFNEAGYEALVGRPEGLRNALPYTENAYLLTLRSMLHLLRRPPQGFEELVQDHFHRRGRFVLRACEAYLRGCIVGTIDGDARATEGSKEEGRRCSAGLRLALANVVPRLLTALAEIGAEGCDCDHLHGLRDMLVGPDDGRLCAR